MKLFLLTLLVFTQAFGFTHKEKVLVRHKKGARTKIVKKKLKNLISKTHFEGKFFKVVKGTSNEPISLTDKDEKLRLKAATTYYHLSKARDFWANDIKSQKVLNSAQTIVRLEIKREFDDLGHYKNKSALEVFNNAKSVPAGEAPQYIQEINSDLGLAPIKPWGDEIWFRPMKKVLAKTLPSHHLGNNPLTIQLQDLKKPVFGYAEGQLKNQTMQHLFWDFYQGSYWRSLAWGVGTVVGMELIIQGSKLMDPLFLEKWYYLDTALIPEVIYHEYSHIVLSDSLEMTHSTAAVEGIADYFAARIADRSVIYEKINNSSTSNPKDLNRKKNYYQIDHENNEHAHGDLVVSILWKVKKQFPKLADKLIYKSREYYSTQDSLIHKDFTNALLKSCDEVCENPLLQRNEFFKIFEKFGL